MAVKKLKKGAMPFPTCTNCGSYSTDGFLRNGGVLMFAHLSAYSVKLGIASHHSAAGPTRHSYDGNDVVEFTTAGVPSGYCASCTTVVRDLLLSHGFKVGPELVEAGGGMTPEQLRKWQQTTLGTCGHLPPRVHEGPSELVWCTKVAKHEGPHAAGTAAWE